MYTIVPSSKFHEKWLLQFCGEPWTFIWCITSLRLQMSSIHYEAKRPSCCLAAMSFSTSALLLCEGADQTRRRAGGLLFVIRGWGGGSIGFDPSWQECPNALLSLVVFSIWKLSVICNAYSLVYCGFTRVLRLELFAMCFLWFSLN